MKVAADRDERKATRVNRFSDKGETPGIRVKIYVREDMIGGGKVELLARLAEHGSVAAAAASMGMEHERAWFLLDTLQRCFDDALHDAKPGAETAPADVTPIGRELIERFAAHRAAVDAASAEFVDWLSDRQRRRDD